MRKTVLVITLFVAALPALAAVQYDFVQRTQADNERVRPTNLTGRAIIDGERARVDFLSGDLYPPGTYCLSLDGSRTLTFVDPIMKSYTEVNLTAVAASLGSSNITVENMKSDTQKMPDHPIVAGIPTEHYRMSITFDMSVAFRSMPLRQSVRTEIDKWTTIEYGDISDTFIAANTIRTGNPQIDQLIELETMKVKGFPLKQTVKITTTNLQGVVPNSKLGMNPVRTQTRELTVMSIKRRDADPVAFIIPAAYKRNDAEALAEKQARTQVTILSFDPTAK
jgi:hypothetical protein